MLRIRERGEALEEPEIPFDLQIEIMNRLPIKSLARFKCVSKLWSSIICSKGYLFPSPPRLFISLISLVERIYDKQKCVLLSLASTSSKSSIAFDLDMTKQGIIVYDMVVLRGLILYIVCDGEACIYNPTTGQRVTLPAIESNILDEEEKMLKFDVYLFGYDPVLDQYKVVCSFVVCQRRRIYGHHWILLLEAESSWKKIECDHVPTRESLCINGVIYYFALSNTCVVQFMSFDVRTEEFSMIQLPHEVSENASTMYEKHVGLIEYNGKPTLFDYKNLKDSLMKLWVLEDTGKWSLVLQSCRLHFVPSSLDLEVIGTTQKGDVFLKYMSYNLYYDLHKKDLRRVNIQGISDHEMDNSIFRSYWALMDTGENIMHLKI